MNWQEDKFRTHIQSAFEEFDPAGADQGWKELRKKFPEKKKNKVIYIWLSGIAASLLLLGFFLFQSKPSRRQDNYTSHTKSPVVIKKSNPVIKKESVGLPQHDVPILTKNTLSTTIQITSLTADAKAIIIIDTIPDQTNPLSANVVPSADVKKKTSIQDFLNEESKLAANSGTAAAKKTAGKTTFDVYTATFLNYYANNPVKVNMGGGINASVQLNEDFSLSLGAGISENSISYSSARSGSIPAASDYIVVDKGVYKPKTTEINASFVNIDLPIALKFYPGKKKNYYLSGGLNSSTYVRQKFDASYTYVPVNGDGIETFNPEQEELKFQGFDFAHSAIIAIGISRPLGKSNNIIFEPFFRPSLRGQGVNGIRINTAGLNIKLNLSREK